MKWSHVEHARGILARERGTIVKDWGGRLPVALVYPNTYQVGMSSLGFQTVYKLLNARPDVVCERAFWQPRFASDDPIPLVESQRPLADAAVVAFSVSYEMDYLHVVQVLRQAGIPLCASERDETWPVVILGGPAVSANPLPLADFCDAVIVGEAEELIAPLVDALWDGIDEPRDVLWEKLAQIPGAYAPQISPRDPGPVQRQWVRDLDAYPTATVIHTPDTEFGNMHLIEVSRGCGRACRFCLAGYTCLPKRERSVDAIVAQAKEGLIHRDRVGLVGAAVSDYRNIDALVVRLRDLGARLSVSSLRVDPLSEPLLAALADSDTRTLTMAPEAGSERLRQVIHKGVTEDALLHAAERATHYGFRQLKLYYMVGLPTETSDDIEAIARLCETVAARFSGRVTANVTPFVPKAHTPLQGAAMESAAVLEERLAHLQTRLRRQGIEVRSESPQWARVQGMLARGDRHLGAVLSSVKGTSLKAWRRALKACGLNEDDYVRARARDEPLPWSFVKAGVSRK